ncbi:Bax inhibitor-1/YccA family protein [Allohahella sp. A8]|uniref:Bax inhibitor-1/YccA family protein n=1 Tax=Allohahella sp. A8 TaxID=3141461 RepID=UPI003A808C64
MQDRRYQQGYNLAAAGAGTSPVVDSDTANTVLKNTYWLLGMTLAFSAFTAFLSSGMAFNPIVHFGALIGALVISFVINKVANSVWGLVLAFAFTGLLGLTIGPIVGNIIAAGQGQVVTTALGLTAFAFFGLSGTALVTKKDFSFLSSFVTIGFFVILGAFILNLFLQIPAVALAISVAIILMSSAAILWQTSAIVRGGETNYILAAVSLYASIYNIFMSLLHILLAFGGDD